jgi:hypothetical protein
LLSKVCQGLSFTTTATVVKMILTFLLLLNLLEQPKDLQEMIKKQLNPELFLTAPAAAQGASGASHER